MFFQYKKDGKKYIFNILGLKLTFNTNKKSKKYKEITFKTFQSLATCIRKNIYKLPADIDLIVGIERSGIIPAYILALFLNKNVCSLNEFINDIAPLKGQRKLNEENNNKYKKILIVDDSVNFGNALNKTKELLAVKDNTDCKFEYLAIYAAEESKDLVDYYFEIAEQPRLFQWNYLNHDIASRCCFDMDGVLCVDPTDEENDDGEKYINFIKNAKPLFIPKYEINAIVTSRLEKYRKLTEEWLKNNNVKYKRLYMLNLETAEERRKQNCHASFKASIYKRLNDTVCFIESDSKQAQDIVSISKKQCICVSTDEYFSE